ncbi:iron-containing alcohol dehydrogenase [Bradyrhizobium jicamae]|uniref:Iron-containing alcohol dehydrogenase n=1 Tax=Bradyrhizobium jicamae TaxID=280332 RepID=A0ABS5FUB9_9BRAD|nr:iron-containing alcohol dehydrogenase [Bradyrhizobium jicamae]MBR0800335.1 iron-containing alcohol dehydrogenase [Bradyrhizobium jicamae]
MQTLTFLTAPTIISGAGSLRQLTEIARGRDCKSVFVVTDPGIVACGYAETARNLLRDAGLAVTMFDKVAADPPYPTVHAAIEAARGAGADFVVGLGGGSSIDTAKVVSVLVNSEQSLDDMIGADKVIGGRLPLIAIPTTAGTGSEVTFVSVLTNDANEKKAIYSPQLMPDVALLDPELTVGMPRHITAATALDAMVHAVEAYTSRTRKNPISDALAVQALQLLGNGLPKVLADGRDIEARSAMLLGATMAGMAFVNASVAAVHALAYPLGARFHIPHGHSNALVMGVVFRFNLPVAAKLYAELAPTILPGRGYNSDEAAANAFVGKLENLAAESGLEMRLSKLGVSDDDVPGMAGEVTEKIARLIATNPRDMSFDDVCGLYRKVL